jgi:hypothetical protein
MFVCDLNNCIIFNDLRLQNSTFVFTMSLLVNLFEKETFLLVYNFMNAVCR